MLKFTSVQTSTPLSLRVSPLVFLTDIAILHRARFHALHFFPIGVEQNAEGEVEVLILEHVTLVKDRRINVNAPTCVTLCRLWKCLIRKVSGAFPTVHVDGSLTRR